MPLFSLFVPKRNPLRAHFKTLFIKIVHEITIRVSYIYSWFTPPNFKKHPNSSFQNLKIVIFFSSPQKFHTPFSLFVPKRTPLRAHFKTLFHKIMHEITIRVSYIYSWFTPPPPKLQKTPKFFISKPKKCHFLFFPPKIPCPFFHYLSPKETL